MSGPNVDQLADFLEMQGSECDSQSIYDETGAKANVKRKLDIDGLNLNMQSNSMCLSNQTMPGSQYLNKIQPN